jgi:lipopolysaccharide heptosyltransferase II
LDREALVARNRRMAKAFHDVSLKERVRRAALFDLARLPVLKREAPPDERILLIRPDHLGDMLLTTPAIRALRAALPNAEIHALVGSWSADVLAAYDEVNVVLTLPFPSFSRATPKASWQSPYALVVQAANHLRRIGYGSAIILRPDHWWGAMLAKFAGIPVRVGYALPDIGPFLTQAVVYKANHAVQQNLRLVERWTGHVPDDQINYSFPFDHVDKVYIDGYLDEWGIAPERPILVIHPGSGTWAKRWEEDRWASVADTLAEQLDAAVVFTGGDPELAMVRRIAAKMQQPACFMVGDTQVSQLAALYARAKVVLGPDSGPLHLAVAVGTPTVALFGPADPAEFGPWGARDKHVVLASSIGCRPCRVLDWNGDIPANHPCLRDITVGQVLEAARRVVAE